jgi:hypothetical protein
MLNVSSGEHHALHHGPSSLFAPDVVAGGARLDDEFSAGLRQNVEHGGVLQGPALVAHHPERAAERAGRTN